MDIADAFEAMLRRAYADLGAKPGPGIDIFIHPTNPISAYWNLEGKTECGKLWLKHMGYTDSVSNTRLAKMKQEAQEWRLSYHTDWSFVQDTVID